MINVVFTFRQDNGFDEVVQKEIDKLQFSRIPEMRIVKGEVEGFSVVPYQANVEDEIELKYLIEKLNQFGSVVVIGKWNEAGEIIEFDLTKYCGALRDVEIFEQAVFINGEDFTDRENEFELIQETDDENNLLTDDSGEPIYKTPFRSTFKRFKSKKRPTLAEAKTTYVNTFNNLFKRNLGL